MFNYTPEQLQAARAAKSSEELISLAKEQGIDITVEQAANFLNPPKGELSDEELENVAGGYCKQGGSEYGREIVTLVTPCVHGLKKYMEDHWVGAEAHGTRRCGSYHFVSGQGGKCGYLSYEKGIWYCNYSRRWQEPYGNIN